MQSPTREGRVVGSELNRSVIPASPAVSATQGAKYPPGTEPTCIRALQISDNTRRLLVHSRFNCFGSQLDMRAGWEQE